MALLDPKDLFKPLGALAALAGSAAVGFVAGYSLGRDPAAARRLLQALARGVDRAQLAVAETREELGDLWAEARSSARSEWEGARFAAAEVDESGEPGERTEVVAAAPSPIEPEQPPEPKRRGRARRGARGSR